MTNVDNHGDHKPKIPDQRWQIYPPQIDKVNQLVDRLNLSPLLAQVLLNRGLETEAETQIFLYPDTQDLPSPLTEFPDLKLSLDLLEEAINQGEQIAICGDYDADGMTSTALLWRSLTYLNAKIDYAIPSRMKEGYGINERIVTDFYHEGVKIILTVDNGISAYQPIAKARELGLKVIITDHHDIPPQLPPANAILNPKLIPVNSPYRTLAGVGVAYILALSLAQRFQKDQELINPMLELFTLGTIADLAALTGVNRRWVKRGLQGLPHSELAGIKALIQVSGMEKGETKAPDHKPDLSSLKPEDIGFKLGPRINAVGRLDDPQIVIELLTTDDPGLALTRALQCEHINKQRQLLCEEIEQEAVIWCEENRHKLIDDRVLLIVQERWHHGVIGIVASRLVERYGVPVFIATYEENNLGENHSKKIRGSARGIPEFNVFDALQYCDNLLIKYGGHKAAGGFSFAAENLDSMRNRLRDFAHQCLKPEHIKPLIIIDAQADFPTITHELYEEITSMQPWGIENAAPIFWTPNVRVIEQKVVGKGHLKVTFAQDFPTAQIPDINTPSPTHHLKGIAWRWGEYYPLPSRVDIAYKLRENNWNNRISMEMELVGIRLPETQRFLWLNARKNQAEFNYCDRNYTCSLSSYQNSQELRIKNAQGQILAIQSHQNIGLLGSDRATAKQVDISQPFFDNLIKAALEALGVV